MWTIFKVFIEFVTILLLFYVSVFCLFVCLFSREACGILPPQPGIEPEPPALEGKVLTTGLSGNSQHKGFETHVAIQASSWPVFIAA